MYVTTALVLVFLVGYGESNPLRVRLSTARNFEVGQNVLVKLSITNEDNKDVFVFHQGTPLEGMVSDCFNVTRNEQPVSYDGAFYKRSPVSLQSEGTTLKSNETTSVMVDLSSAYSVGNTGSYAAAFLSRIFIRSGGATVHSDVKSLTVHFVVIEGAASGGVVVLTTGQQQRRKWGNYSKELGPRKVELKAGNVKLGAPKGVTFLGSYDNYDVSEANAAWTKAYSRLTTGISYLTSYPTQYYYWFGMLPEDTAWSNAFSLIKSSMEEDTYQLYFHGPDCQSNTFAYTYVGTRTIYLCGQYISAPDTGYDTKYGTLVHEMSHAVVATKDIVYGRVDARDLALTYPLLAVENADNYEYYVETE